MGAEQTSQRKSGLLSIWLEKNVFFPGEVIKGLLQLKGNFKIKMGHINFQIKQEENWNIHTMILKDQGKNSRPLTNVTVQYSNLINIPLDKGISIPFSIQIPCQAVPSFEYSLHDKHANIRTILSVNLGEISAIAVAVIIIKSPAVILNSPLRISSDKNTKVLGLVDQGAILLEGVYPSNNFSFFSTIPLTVTLDTSKSKLKVKEIEVKLIRYIKFLQHTKENLLMEWKEELYGNKTQTKAKQLSLNYQIQVIEPNSLYDRYDFSKIGMVLRDKRQMINFLPSISTGMIVCEYYIHVEAKLDVIIKGVLKNPTLKMPLAITHQSTGEVSAYIQAAFQQFSQSLNQINGFVNYQYQVVPNMSMVPQAQPQQMPPQQQYPNQNMAMGMQHQQMPPQQQYPNQNMAMGMQHQQMPPQQQYPNQNMAMGMQPQQMPPQQQYPNQNMAMGMQPQQMPPQQQYPNQNMAMGMQPQQMQPEQMPPQQYPNQNMGMGMQPQIQHQQYSYKQNMGMQGQPDLPSANEVMNNYPPPPKGMEKPQGQPVSNQYPSL